MEASASPSSPLPDGAFEGREAFRQCVRDALRTAAVEGWPELILCDGDFLDWPLGERAVAEALHDWAGAGRRCTILAQDFRGVQQHHARFVDWRRRWDHLLTCRRLTVRDPLEAPSLLWSPRWALQRIDPVHSRAIASAEAARCLRWRELLDEWVRSKSSPGFASTTLGLG